MKAMLATAGDTSIVDKYWLKKINPEKLDILVAFPFIHGNVTALEKLKEKQRVGMVFLDAGTYTLHNAPTTAPVMASRFAEYAHYVKLYGKSFDVIASYDENFSDPELNMFNYERMRCILKDTGIEDRLIPVVHAPPRVEQKHRMNVEEEFLYYKKRGCKYIAIGSYPPIPDADWLKLEAIREDIKIHFFGNFRANVLRDRRPFSIDGSHFAKAAAFHSVMRWTGDQLQTVNLTNAEENPGGEADIQWVENYIAQNFPRRTIDSIIADPSDSGRAPDEPIPPMTIDSIIADPSDRQIFNISVIKDMEADITAATPLIS